MKILFFGDVMGRPGREAVIRALPVLRDEYHPDLVIVNGENLAHGAGVTERTLGEMLDAGVDAVTSGNHIFDKDEIAGIFAAGAPVVRPYNLKNGEYGKGFMVIEKNGVKVVIGNIVGSLFMEAPDENPFLAIDALRAELPADAKVVIIDFHAEATSEKRAMGFYLDGKVSAVLGTHTHVGTADEQILPSGTAYITDIGMVGTVNSVIGMEKDAVIQAFQGEKTKPKITMDGAREINAVFIDIDEQSGRARAITRVHRAVEE